MVIMSKVTINVWILCWRGSNEAGYSGVQTVKGAALDYPILAMPVRSIATPFRSRTPYALESEEFKISFFFKMENLVPTMILPYIELCLMAGTIRTSVVVEASWERSEDDSRTVHNFVVF